LLKLRVILNCFSKADPEYKLSLRDHSVASSFPRSSCRSEATGEYQVSKATRLPVVTPRTHHQEPLQMLFRSRTLESTFRYCKAPKNKKYCPKCSRSRG